MSMRVAKSRLAAGETVVDSKSSPPPAAGALVFRATARMSINPLSAVRSAKTSFFCPATRTTFTKVIQAEEHRRILPLVQHDLFIFFGGLGTHLHALFIAAGVGSSNNASIELEGLSSPPSDGSPDFWLCAARTTASMSTATVFRISSEKPPAGTDASSEAPVTVVGPPSSCPLAANNSARPSTSPARFHSG